MDGPSEQELEKSFRKIADVDVWCALFKLLVKVIQSTKPRGWRGVLWAARSKALGVGKVWIGRYCSVWIFEVNVSWWLMKLM
jgi:hypothetical protein